MTRLACWNRLGTGWEINGESTSFPWLACHIDPAFMLPDYPVNCGQSQSGALADFFSGKKGFENTAHGGRVHSASGILDRKAQERTRTRIGMGLRIFLLDLNRRGVN